MRTLIENSKISFTNGTRAITVTGKVFSRLQLRLLVNETQKVLLTNTLDKDLVTVSDNGTDTTITYDSSLPVLVTGDTLAIDIDETVEISGGSQAPTFNLNLNFSATNNFAYYHVQQAFSAESFDNNADLILKKNGVSVSLPAAFSVGDILTVTYNGLSSVNRILHGNYTDNSLTVIGKNIAPNSTVNERWINALFNYAGNMYQYGSAGLRKLINKELIFWSGKTVESNPIGALWVTNRAVVASDIIFMCNTNESSNFITYYNFLTGANGNISLSYTPFFIGYDSTSGNIFVLTGFAAYVISPISQSIVYTFSSLNMTYSPNCVVGSGKAYFNSGDTLKCVNMSTGAITTVSGMKVAFAIVGSYVYAGSYNSGNVYKLNISDNTTAATITASIGGYNAAVCNSYLFIVNTLGGNIKIINLSNDTLNATTITVGSNPVGVFIDNSNNYIYVCNTGAFTISVVDAVNLSIAETIDLVNKHPYIILEDASRGILVCSSTDGHTIHEFSKLTR